MEIKRMDLFEEAVKPAVLEQYKESRRWLSILKTVIDRIQDVEDAAVQFQTILDIENSSGSKLDWIASLVNMPRYDGENDGDFKRRIQRSLAIRAAGTPDEIISAASYESQSKVKDVSLIEEIPGVFFVYTPKGRQIPYHKVQKMAPAGVLGFPAAAFKLADGRYLVDGSKVEYEISIENEIVMINGEIVTYLELPARRLLLVAREENIVKIK